MHQSKAQDSGIAIRNWHKFQHFKDRKPPWIKLYRDLLDDVEWHELSAEAAKALVMLWLIASESDGKLPDIKAISFRLRMSEKAVNALIKRLENWLDITMISRRYQDDAPETEGEIEKERERETDNARPGALVVGSVDPQFLRVWEGLGKYGVRKKALDYWRRIPQADRDAIEAAVPGYMDAVAAGRKQMQAEGWLNPQHRRWDVDWSRAVQVESAAGSGNGQRSWIGGLGTGGL